ncbi:hypothetical protein [Paenibacillus ferrarius]|nr:hypothetical protein [Paenibacillus ferrarius]
MIVTSLATAIELRLTLHDQPGKLVEHGLLQQSIGCWSSVEA